MIVSENKKARLEEEVHKLKQELRQAELELQAAEQERDEINELLHIIVTKTVAKYGLEKAKEMTRTANCYDLVDWTHISESMQN